MRLMLYILIGVIGLVAGAPDAHARKICFGSDENLRTIQKVGVEGPKGEPLELARKIRNECFLLPYTVYDDGYVLVKEDGKTYYDLTSDQISEFQKGGTLPTPLPAFELSTLDYVFGYSLWILLAVIAGWGLIDWLRGRGDDAPAE